MRVAAPVCRRFLARGPAGEVPSENVVDACTGFESRQQAKRLVAQLAERLPDKQEAAGAEPAETMFMGL